MGLQEALPRWPQCLSTRVRKWSGKADGSAAR